MATTKGKATDAHLRSTTSRYWFTMLLRRAVNSDMRSASFFLREFVMVVRVRSVEDPTAHPCSHSKNVCTLGLHIGSSSVTATKSHTSTITQLIVQTDECQEGPTGRAKQGGMWLYHVAPSSVGVSGGETGGTYGLL